MRKYRLETILFISGAVVMILELSGSRIVAPFLGTSIYVWTSLIGIILGSLSLGYWLGGQLADRKPDYGAFTLLLLGAALLIGLISFTQTAVLAGIQQHIADIRIGAVLAATILFAPASILLGTITPFAVRLKIRNVSGSGAMVGRLYAISTVGSIVGTFLAGFYLIAYFGSGKILMVLSLALFFCAMLAYDNRMSPGEKIIGACLVACLLPVYGFSAPNRGGVVHDLDTRYNRVIIEDRLLAKTGKTVRYLRVDRDWGQSAVVVGEPDELYFEYNRFYRLVDHFAPANRQVLLIGGGAYTYPRDYLRRNPLATIDVVEIDPAFTELAKRYFYLTDDPRMTIYHEDGRTFLNRSHRQYDAVFVDIFKSAASPPFQLTTVEAMRSMAQRLRPGGVLLTNIYASILGSKGRFLRAAYQTLQAVFPRVLVFPVQFPENGHAVQNILLVALTQKSTPALSSANPELHRYLAHRYPYPIPDDMPVLRDRFAPVEHYLVDVIKAH